MKHKILKLSVLMLVISTLSVGGFYLWKVKKSVEGLDSVPEVLGAAHLKSADPTQVTEHKAETGGHGSPEGHGEAKKAEGGHGEPAKAEGGHGGGESKGERAPASVASKGVPLFSVEEVFVNIRSEKEAHLMGLKLELELFEEEQRDIIKVRHSGIRDRIIELSRRFDYGQLVTLGGKLYFKEKVVSTLNEFFGQAVVKEAHISSLYLQ